MARWNGLDRLRDYVRPLATRAGLELDEVIELLGMGRSLHDIECLYPDVPGRQRRPVPTPLPVPARPGPVSIVVAPPTAPLATARPAARAAAGPSVSSRTPA